MAEGEILGEEAVILGEEAVTLGEEAATQEEEGEIQQPLTTNCPDNSPRYSMGIERSRRRSCRNGLSTGESIDSLHK